MTPGAASSVLTVMIVDDEAPARARLRDLLADIAPQLANEVVCEAPDGRAALASIERRWVDVLLVDIRMPRMDGIELARHLLHFEPRPAVVFVTAFDAYAVRAFELNAVDYLLKPVGAQRLLAALRKVRERAPLTPAQIEPAQQAARSHLSCVERGRLLLIPVAEIIYLKAEWKYVTVRTRSREYLLDESLTQLEQEFGEQFIRLHRSVLATREAIVGFEKCGTDDADAQWQAMLRDVPERLPVSRRQWPLVRSFARQVSP